MVLVVGARNSSNSNRLAEIGMTMDVPAYLIEDVSKLREEWFEKASVVGITAGASAPEELVEKLIDRMGALFDIKVEEMSGVEELVHFPLPEELSIQSESAASSSDRKTHH